MFCINNIKKQKVPLKHMILHLCWGEVPEYNRQPGEYFELKTSFTPEPIIDMGGVRISKHFYYKSG